jgi:hypothetical protein
MTTDLATTEPPIAPDEPMHPMDRGLSIADWAERDFPAFADAVLSACGGDEASILADMVERQSRNQPVRVPERVMEAVRRRLKVVGDERPEWVEAWCAKRVRRGQ